MKAIIISVLLLAASFMTNAQDFKKDGNYVTAGYGIDVASGLPGTIVGIGLGPIMATYERGVTDILGIGRIGAGGGIAFSHYNPSSSTLFLPYYTDLKSVNRWTIFIKGTYHFEFNIEKLDVYAGVGVGVNLDFRKYDVYTPNLLGVQVVEDRELKPSAVHYIVVGARYYFSDAFGVYLELGDGIANVNGGVVFSF